MVPLLQATNPQLQPCSCCGRILPLPLWVGDIGLCDQCRPDDVDAYHEQLITGPWPPAILRDEWVCPHQAGA
jgi:hypothetical protein